jgi:hypothetical protein
MTPERLEQIRNFAWETSGIGDAVNMLDECVDEIDRLREKIKASHDFIAGRCYCGSIVDLAVQCANCCWLKQHSEIK